VFIRNLSLHMKGADVFQLQHYLNTRGSPIAATGAGSPGHETTLFGLRTYRALVKLQAAHGLPATGFFGPLTSKLLSETPIAS
jgi:hypothetical protein